MPGTRVRREFGGVFRARHHLDRSHPQRPAVRTFRQCRTPRTARHRRRFRTRAARGSDPVDLRHLWPRPRRPLRHDHPLSRPRRSARRRQGDGSDRGRDQRPRLPGLELERGRRRRGARRCTELQSGGPPAAADHGPGARADGVSAAYVAASRRFRFDRGTTGRSGARSSPPAWSTAR